MLEHTKRQGKAFFLSRNAFISPYVFAGFAFCFLITDLVYLFIHLFIYQKKKN